MKRTLLLLAVVGVAALVAWLLTRRGGDVADSKDSAGGTGDAAAPAGLLPSPGPQIRRSADTAATAAPDGSAVCEIHVTTFGDPAREVEIAFVSMPTIDPPARGVVRVRTKPRTEITLGLVGTSIASVRVDVPDPVPSRIDVRVPALDDPRLLDPVLLVVDEKTGISLPDAVLDPGAKAPDEMPVRAGSDGTIRVPHALVERLSANAALGQAGVITERAHLPRSFASLVGWSLGTRADWAEWNATGVMRVRLQPIEGDDAAVPRRRLRVVDEDGRTRAGRLVLLRTVTTDLLSLPSFPGRTDASGTVDVLAPRVAAYDVYDGAALVATFVLANDPEDAALTGDAREIRVPQAVRVHVVVRGLAEPRPFAWLVGPEVVALDPDEKTGWSRVDGKEQPGWKAFARAGVAVKASETLPAEMDVVVPRGTPVALDIGDRRATLRADAATTIEIDWATLPPVPKNPGSVGFSITREGLDEGPHGGPTSAK